MVSRTLAGPGLEGEAVTSPPRALFELVEAGTAAVTRVLAAWAVLAMVAMVAYEVLSRSLFNAPTSWVTEYATYLLVALAFVGAAAAQWNRQHIRIELLTGLLGTHHRRRADAVAAWLGVGFLLLLCWQLGGFVRSEYLSDARDWGLLATPLWVPETSMILGAALFCFALLGEVRALSPKVGGARDAAVVALLLGCCLLLGLLEAASLAPVTRTLAGSAAILACLLLSAAIWSGPAVACLVATILIVLGLLFFAVAEASPLAMGGALLVGLALLLALSVKVALVLGILAAAGFVLLLPVPVMQVLGERAWSATNSFTLTAIPMFVFMGGLLLRSGVSAEIFEAMRKLFGRVPGGIGYASIGACGLFAAVSGSSLATAATMGTVACPAMTEQGYSRRLAYGLIAAGGTLGILIPPSIAMILYGATAGVPITDLFIGGLLPGLMLMALFAVTLFLWSLLVPGAVPAGTGYSWGEKLRSSRGILPFVALLVAVIASLYFGVATPTEAGAVGSVAAAALCALRGRLTRRALFSAMTEAAAVTSLMLVIVVGAAQIGYLLDYLQIPGALIALLGEGEQSAVGVMIGLVAAYLVLGMFIDPVSMMLITLPVVLPMITAVGFDPLWFGVVMVTVIEIGLITPPVGMVLYVLKGVGSSGSDLKEVALGALPFVVTILVAIALLTLLPEIVTWLPAQAR